MFDRFRKPRKVPVLDTDKAMGERAERAGTPARTIHSFVDFGGPDQTVHAVQVEEYLPLLKDALGALRHEIAFDAAKFESLVMPMIKRYLAWVHLLPASASHHHARLGGLAVHGLDVAALAARNAHNAVLDFDPAYTRDLELRANRRSLWPLAAATAGLHHDLGKVLIDQIITCADTGEVWNPFVSDLCSWAGRNNVARYAVRWRTGDRLHRHESFGLLLMGAIAGPDVLGTLAGLGRDVMEAVVTSVSGERDDASGMRQMVHKADAASSKLDRDAGSAYWSEGSASVDPIIGRLMEAAAGLVSKRAWKINTPGHPIWVTPDGAYLMWPQAFNSMRQELLNQQNAVGIPNDPTEVAEIFLRAKVAAPREFSNGQRVALWALHLPEGDKTAEPSSAFDAMMAKLGNVKSALYIPIPDALIGSAVVSEHADIRVARDPTLPEVAEPEATEQQAQEVSPPVSADESTVASATEDIPADNAATATTSESRPKDDEKAAAPGDASPVGRPQAAERKDTASPGDALAGAISVLREAGALGAVLEKLANRIALEPDSFPSRDRFSRKNDVLLMRWPEAVKDDVKNIRDLAEAIERMPSWLADRVAGQPVDVASNGITMSQRVRGSTWNVVPLNPSLTSAFTVLAQRNQKPTSQDLP